MVAGEPEPRERELKFRLSSRDEFERLCSLPAPRGCEAPELQTNHYFDTKDLFLVRQRVMLRVRETEDYVMTLKCGREVRPGFFDSLEIESVLQPEDLRTILTAPDQILKLSVPAIVELKKRFGALELCYLGNLKTARFRRQGPGGLVFEIDRVTFPDLTEKYELELELDTARSEAAEKAAERELQRLGIRAQPQRMTKLEQFLEWAREH